MDAPEDAGFTLVELLVAMVIIAALAAIVIPVFLTQRAKAYASAMKADLNAIVLSEASWNLSNESYTTDLAQLRDEGYQPSSRVTAHVALVGSHFVACTRHAGATEWLVYDSTTGTTTTSAADCAA